MKVQRTNSTYEIMIVMPHSVVVNACKWMKAAKIYTDYTNNQVKGFPIRMI